MIFFLTSTQWLLVLSFSLVLNKQLNCLIFPGAETIDELGCNCHIPLHTFALFQFSGVLLSFFWLLKVNQVSKIISDHFQNIVG